MSNTHTAMPPLPVLTASEPQLFVANMQRSCDFFTEGLGFKVEFVYGDPPFYAQVSRDLARLNLRLIGEPVFAGDVRKREGLLSASMTVATVSGIQQLFQECQASKLPFHQVLKQEAWGSMTFVVLDPDGNLLLFAGPAE